MRMKICMIKNLCSYIKYQNGHDPFRFSVRVIPKKFIFGLYAITILLYKYIIFGLSAKLKMKSNTALRHNCEQSATVLWSTWSSTTVGDWRPTVHKSADSNREPA
jgi:hypothetical protein